MVEILRIVELKRSQISIKRYIWKVRTALDERSKISIKAIKGRSCETMTNSSSILSIHIL
jgi:hypothetical protein